VSAKLRVFVRNPLQADTELLLDDEAARHVQVLRLQPGMWLELFNGEDGCYPAQVLHMGRQQVQVLVHSFLPDVASLACRSHLVLGMPANERMDWLVEKATELGVSRITPLMTQRTVLKLQGERALKRQQHWLGIAQSACAQSGRNRVPQIDVAQTWSAWWSQHKAGSDIQQFVLSLQPQARPWRDLSRTPPAAVCILSGPEGGLSEEEESLAIANGFAPVSLGAHTLRSETAPLVVLSQLL
jgi:16S rRNA (uracil1498-N3)-methyltransferase